MSDREGEARRPERPRPSLGPEGRDPAFYEALGRAIKVLRTERGLGRRELAEAAGVSYPYLSEIENARKQASSRAVLAIAEALGLRPQDVFEAADALRETIEQERPPRRPSREELFPERSWGPRRVAMPGPATRARLARSREAAGGDAEIQPDWSPEEGERDPWRLRQELLLLVRDLSEEDLVVLVALARRLAGMERSRFVEP